MLIPHANTRTNPHQYHQSNLNLPGILLRKSRPSRSLPSSKNKTQQTRRKGIMTRLISRKTINVEAETTKVGLTNTKRSLMRTKNHTLLSPSKHTSSTPRAKRVQQIRPQEHPDGPRQPGVIRCGYSTSGDLPLQAFLRCLYSCPLSLLRPFLTIWTAILAMTTTAQV